jgi:secreted trypsin-like serine protease
LPIEEIYMIKKMFSLVILIAAILIMVTPAGAITSGEPDGNRHPNVALLGLILTDGTRTRGCSGVLISPTVILTAGHCTAALSHLVFTQIWASFDSEVDPNTSNLLSVVSFATDPDFDPQTGFNDVGVVILSEPVLDIRPVVLPTENLLSQMKAAGMLESQTFVNVGYGVTVLFKTMPPTLTKRDGVRRFSTSPYRDLTQDWLGLLANSDATGAGGTCSGDSGGPQFLGDSNVIVSIHAWGDGICRAMSNQQRLDTSLVRAFLDDYVTLP